MKTTLSTKGQIVVPGPIRAKLGLHPGDRLEIEIDSGRIILTPLVRTKYAIRIVTDPQTGLPLAVAEQGSPKFTSEEVAELLADFP